MKLAIVRKDTEGITAAELRRRFAMLDSAARLAVLDQGHILLGKIQEGLPGARLADMRRSWKMTQPAKSGGKWSLSVYSTHPRSRLREEGGVVSAGKGPALSGPRKGQKTLALAIPLPRAKTPSGISRGGPSLYAGRLVWLPPKGATRDAQGRVQLSGNYRGVLAEMASRKAKPKILFALYKSVVVPAIPVLGPAVVSTQVRRTAATRFRFAQALEKKAA